jgi:lipoprotein-releasing system ATP-binding protein
MSEPIADPPKKALVSVRNLHKTFIHMGRPLHVLRGIDLDLGEGEVVAIVGRSGAGKSTLLHCIGTLDLPSSGSIRLGNYDLVGLESARLAAIRNAMIGFVFQFHHLLPEFNALENVMMPGLIQGRSRTEMVRRGEMLLSEVGLSHRATHRPGELSGGEQQRVALARALVLEPKLILADEPTGNLDTTTSDAIHQLFFDVNGRHGTTIVVVTHNVAFAQGMPRVVTMSDGQIFSDQRIEPKGPPSSAITAVAPDPASIPGATSQPGVQPATEPGTEPDPEAEARSEPSPSLSELD